jgi:hypothetical protein
MQAPNWEQVLRVGGENHTSITCRLCEQDRVGELESSVPRSCQNVARAWRACERLASHDNVKVTVHGAWWISPGECQVESGPVELSPELLPERCQLFAGIESLAVRRRIAPRDCERVYADRWEMRPRDDGVAP